MASSINTSTTGTSYISGLFSGIDTATLIQNAVNAKLIPKTRLDDQISTNLNKITTFQELRSQTEQLKGLFDKLKSDLVGNVFSSQKATYISSTNTQASSLLTTTLTKDALPGNHTVVVEQTAKPFAAQGTNQTSVTTALGYTGTFDIKQDGKTASTISITATDTLQTLRNKINASSSTTGVSADIVQVTPGNYRLIIRGKEGAQNVSVSNITGDNVLQNLGMTDGAGTFLDITQTPQQAKIILNGTAIYSDSNRFDNVLTGVTIDVTNADPATTLNMTVGADTDAVKTAIQDAVEGYNFLQTTIKANQAINADGSVGDTAYLYGEFLNSSLGTRLTQAITGSYGNGAFNGLRSLGISINSSNELVIDDTALTKALTTNYDDVRKVFETQGSNVGLGDTVSSLLNEYSNFVSGSIQKQIQTLQTTNSDLTQKSDDIQTSVDQYKLDLISKYATMEAKLKQADTVKRQITAILDGQNSRY